MVDLITKVGGGDGIVKLLSGVGGIDGVKNLIATLRGGAKTST